MFNKKLFFFSFLTVSSFLQADWPRPGDKGAVHFYHYNKSYYEFANTYAVDIYLDGHTWKSAEHYFQAGKFNDPWLAYNQGINSQQALKNIGFGQLQKEMRNYKNKISDEAWRKISFSRMLKALWAKFTQDTYLQEKLLETKNKIIVEDAGSIDPFYGAGGNYAGENHLGQMLMHIRDWILLLNKCGENIKKDFKEFHNDLFVYHSRKPQDYNKLYDKKKLILEMPCKSPTKPSKKKENEETITSFAKALKSIP